MKIYYLVNVLIQIASVLTSIFMMYSKLKGKGHHIYNQLQESLIDAINQI
jgi:hypothetical protein